MRFDLTDDQRAVRDAIDELCRTRWKAADVRRFIAGADDGEALWAELASAGWTGAAVPLELGGHGLGTVELALVCEGLGRALAPAAFFGNAAAATLLAGSADAELKERWLPGFASGEARGALAVRGPKGRVLALDADRAAAVVIVAGDSVSIAATSACTLEPVRGVDLTRRLSQVSVRDAVEVNGAQPAIDRLEVLLSAELTGVANRALDLAVDHARTRLQFGRPIGAYQAISHRCADMLLDVESARSAVLCAAWTADHDAAALPFASSVAKVAAAQGAWRVTTSALQVHGGIGFTWDHDCHLLLRRAVASGRLLGSVESHLDRVFELRAGARVAPEVGAAV